jgi:hypothetical protein
MVKALPVILFFWMCMLLGVQSLFGAATPTAVEQINALQETLRNENLPSQKILSDKLRLAQLYHRTGAYQKAFILLRDIPPKTYALAKGEYFLARAQNAKYQFQIDLSKQFFELALIDFSLRQEQCKLLETHIELMEYYRKIDAIELAFKEADVIKEFLRKNTSCNPIHSLPQPTRVHSKQRFSPGMYRNKLPLYRFLQKIQ